MWMQNTYLATRCAQRTIRRDSNCVEVTSVSNVVDLQLAVGKVPYLHHPVPASRHNDGVVVIGGEADAWHPVTVALILQQSEKVSWTFTARNTREYLKRQTYGNSVFALSKCVPQLDGLVSASGHNLTVVDRESNAQHILKSLYWLIRKFPETIEAYK